MSEYNFALHMLLNKLKIEWLCQMRGMRRQNNFVLNTISEKLVSYVTVTEVGQRAAVAGIPRIQRRFCAL